MASRLKEPLSDFTKPVEEEGKSKFENDNGNLSAQSSSDSLKSPSVPVRPEVRVDDSSALVCYANFCRVTGTPEELILDFGLNSLPMGTATNVEIKQRLVVNYFTAKRLLNALALSVQRHEGAFGVLETDVQKRVTPAVRRAATAN